MEENNNKTSITEETPKGAIENQSSDNKDEQLKQKNKDVLIKDLNADELFDLSKNIKQLDDSILDIVKKGE